MPPAFTQREIEAFMHEALAEGLRALPDCRPNPPVGCVLVRDSVIVARGYTQPPYQPHAEPMALRQLEGELRDVTAFVSLEPCSFHQRTPSCAKDLISRKVGLVYVALLDPHPHNQGAGIQLLRDAGIQVVTGILEAEARVQLGPYLYGSGDPQIGW